jgi:hypothetical protein
MPTISFTISTAEAVRMASAFAKAHNYQDKVVDKDNKIVDNPQSKADFAKEKVMQYVKDVVRSVEIEEAKKAVSMPADINIS